MVEDLLGHSVELFNSGEAAFLIDGSWKVGADGAVQLHPRSHCGAYAPAYGNAGRRGD